MTQETQQQSHSTSSALSGFKKKSTVAETHESSSEALSKLDSGAQVRIIHGARDMEFPITGQTVASARSKFQTLFNFAPDANAFILGEKVSEDYVLKQGDTLEFLKEAGVKGV